MNRKMMRKSLKPKNFKQGSKKLIKYINKYIYFILIAVAVTSIAAVGQVLGPNILKNMTKEIMNGINPEAFFKIDMDKVYSIGITLATIYTSSIILNYVQGFIMATITQKTAKKMRADISKKINKLPLAYFDKVSHGEVLSRVTNDVDTIGMTMNQSIGALVSAVTLLVGSLIMMFINSWILALTAISTSILGFLLMSLVMKFSQKFFSAQQKELGELNGYIEETYSGHKIVKAYNGEEKAINVFSDINENLYKSAWKSQFLSGLMMPIMNFVGNFSYVAVCVIGSILTLNGKLGFEVIVAFMIYIRLFTQPLSQIAQGMQNLQRTIASSERVFEFLDEKELEDESFKEAKLNSVRGNVEFRNVKFGYKEDRIIIKDFSALVKAGQKIAIVGPTGAGKTTLVNLLMRFYELNSGQILIDNIPINEVPRENVHEQFSMVLQDTWLFESSIEENIVYCKENVSKEEIISACRAVGLHHFITTLPEGYNTILDDLVSLSQGQKQLLTIARAMIQNAPMLILDEATSSVDTRTEILVQEAMDKLTKGRTSFIIAHRLSTIKNADLILVLKDGDIIEKGNHENLIEQNGFYSDLWKSQFETYEEEKLA